MSKYTVSIMQKPKQSHKLNHADILGQCQGHKHSACCVCRRLDSSVKHCRESVKNKYPVGKLWTVAVQDCLQDSRPLPFRLQIRLASNSIKFLPPRLTVDSAAVYCCSAGRLLFIQGLCGTWLDNYNELYLSL